MNQKYVVIIMTLILGMLLLLGCTDTKVVTTNQKTNTPDTNIVQQTISDTNAQTGVSIVSVDIRNFAFVPATITIHAGDTVIWRNYDSMGHTITGGELNSPVLQSGMTYSHTFTTTGTTDYICTIHPSMKGTVIIT